LVEEVVLNYKETCLTGERRVQAAKSYGVEVKLIETQCQTIVKALGETLTQHLN
jgi:hypothetical protein